MGILRRSRLVLLASVLAGGMNLVGAVSVLANHPIVNGQGACSQGQQVVTWTVTNSETTVAAGGSGRTMTIDALSVSQGAVSGLSVGEVLQPQPESGSTVTGVTTLSGNSTGNVSLSVTGHFYNPDGSDSGLVDTESATVMLAGGCTPTSTQTSTPTSTPTSTQAPTQTIAGHIYDCSSGTATTNEVPGGTLGASGPQTVATQANPLLPTQVAAGTYTMGAGSPLGYQFVVCGGTAVVTSPSSATEPVIVPSGGVGVGIFYVTKIAPTSTAIPPTATSTATPVPPTATGTSTTTNNPPPQNPPFIPSATPTSTSTTTPVTPATNTATSAPSATDTATPADTATATGTPGVPATSTGTPVTPATDTATPAPSVTSTDTPAPGATDTDTPVATPTDTGTPVPSPTDTATDTPTRTPKLHPTTGVTIVSAPTSTATSTPRPTHTPKPTATRVPIQLATATPAGSAAEQVTADTPTATSTPKPKIRSMTPGNTNVSVAPTSTTIPTATEVPSPTPVAYVVPKALPHTGDGGTTGVPAWFVLLAGTLIVMAGTGAGAGAWLTSRIK